MNRSSASPHRAMLLLLPLAGLLACHMHADRDRLRARATSFTSPSYTAAAVAPLPADTPTPPTADDVRTADTLAPLLHYALHHNQALRAAYERFLAATERVPQVSSLPDPQLQFAQFVEKVQTRTGPQQRRWSLTQAFPWFGTLRQRSAVAEQMVEEAWQRVEASRQTVVREVRVAFAELGYLGQAARITGEVLDLLHQLEPVVQQRIAAGTATQADLLRLQLEIGRVENERVSQLAALPSLKARLGAAMTLPVGAAATLPVPTLGEPSPTVLVHDALLQRAREHNPGLRELAERAATRREQRELASYQRWPDLQVGVDYLETDAAAAPVPGSGDDPWALRVGFSLPIWTARYAAAEREAERELRAASAELADRRERLDADVLAAVFHVEDADRQLLLYRDTLLPRARDALTVIRAAYGSGTASLLDLIDSERALLQFEVGYWRACRDHHQSQAKLDELLGGSL